MDVPFSIIVPTIYGQMVLNRYDINQFGPLLKTGHSLDHREIELLSAVLRASAADPVVLDVGANFGAFSLGLSRVIGPRGKVHAFEPQRIVFNMLAGSVALNSLLNVHCYHMAVGDHEGRIEIPQFDYSKPMNFGSIEFTAEQREKLPQVRGNDPDRVEHVPITTLDRFAFQRVDVLKIDVEGMEMQVLDGAKELIRRCRPVMLIEFLKVGRQALHQRVVDSGYAVYENTMNYLCVPVERADRITIVGGKIHVTGG